MLNLLVYSVLGYRFYHFSLFFIRNAHIPVRGNKCENKMQPRRDIYVIFRLETYIMG